MFSFTVCANVMHAVDILDLIRCQLAAGHAVPLLTHTLTLDILPLVGLLFALPAKIFILFFLLFLRVFLHLSPILLMTALTQPIPTPI